MSDVIVKWKCPNCNHKYKWMWPRYDVFEGIISMECEDSCNASTQLCLKYNEKQGYWKAVPLTKKQKEDYQNKWLKLAKD